MRRAWLATCLLLALPACGSGGAEQEPSAQRQQVIDVTAGTYRRVPLGGAPGDVHRQMGPKDPAGEDEPGTPLRGESYGPWSISYGDEPCPTALYRYDYAAFGFNCGKLLWAETTEPGAETAEGVAVGDPLAAVEPAYPGAVCGTAGGGEYEEYPACSLRVAPGRYVWFGGDPITTIAIGAVELEGVYEDEPFTGEVFVLQAGEFVTYPPGEAKTGDRSSARSRASGSRRSFRVRTPVSRPTRCTSPRSLTGACGPSAAASTPRRRPPEAGSRRAGLRSILGATKGVTP